MTNHRKVKLFSNVIVLPVYLAEEVVLQICHCVYVQYIHVIPAPVSRLAGFFKKDKFSRTKMISIWWVSIIITFPGLISGTRSLYTDSQIKEKTSLWYIFFIKEIPVCKISVSRTQVSVTTRFCIHSPRPNFPFAKIKGKRRTIQIYQMVTHGDKTYAVCLLR